MLQNEATTRKYKHLQKQQASFESIRVLQLLCFKREE